MAIYHYQENMGGWVEGNTAIAIGRGEESSIFLSSQNFNHAYSMYSFFKEMLSSRDHRQGAEDFSEKNRWMKTFSIKIREPIFFR